MKTFRIKTSYVKDLIMRFVRQNQQSIPKSIESLAMKTQEILGVRRDGLVVYLADEDFSRYPNPVYHNVAFHINIKTGGVEEISPQDIIEIMKDSSTINFVWLSKNGWERGNIAFVWIYAHELKHLMQDIATPDIHDKTKQLIKLYNFSGRSTINVYNIPVEYDADLGAKYVLEQLFSEDESINFFNTMIRDETRVECFKKLQLVNGTLDYNYAQQTDNLIRKLNPSHNAVQKADTKT